MRRQGDAGKLALIPKADRAAVWDMLWNKHLKKTAIDESMAKACAVELAKMSSWRRAEAFNALWDRLDNAGRGKLIEAFGNVIGSYPQLDNKELIDALATKLDARAKQGSLDGTDAVYIRMLPTFISKLKDGGSLADATYAFADKHVDTFVAWAEGVANSFLDMRPDGKWLWLQTSVEVCDRLAQYPGKSDRAIVALAKAFASTHWVGYQTYSRFELLCDAALKGKSAGRALSSTVSSAILGMVDKLPESDRAKALTYYIGLQSNKAAMGPTMQGIAEKLALVPEAERLQVYQQLQGKCIQGNKLSLANARACAVGMAKLPLSAHSRQFKMIWICADNAGRANLIRAMTEAMAANPVLGEASMTDLIRERIRSLRDEKSSDATLGHILAEIPAFVASSSDAAVTDILSMAHEIAQRSPANYNQFVAGAAPFIFGKLADSTLSLAAICQRLSDEKFNSEMALIALTQSFTYDWPESAKTFVNFELICKAALQGKWANSVRSDFFMAAIVAAVEDLPAADRAKALKLLISLQSADAIAAGNMERIAAAIAEVPEASRKEVWEKLRDQCVKNGSLNAHGAKACVVGLARLPQADQPALFQALWASTNKIGKDRILDAVGQYIKTVAPIDQPGVFAEFANLAIDHAGMEYVVGFIAGLHPNAQVVVFKSLGRRVLTQYSDYLDKKKPASGAAAAEQPTSNLRVLIRAVEKLDRNVRLEAFASLLEVSKSLTVGKSSLVTTGQESNILLMAVIQLAAERLYTLPLTQQHLGMASLMNGIRTSMQQFVGAAANPTYDYAQINESFDAIFVRLDGLDDVSRLNGVVIALDQLQQVYRADLVPPGVDVLAHREAAYARLRNYTDRFPEADRKWAASRIEDARQAAAEGRPWGGRYLDAISARDFDNVVWPSSFDGGATGLPRRLPADRAIIPQSADEDGAVYQDAIRRINIDPKNLRDGVSISDGSVSYRNADSPLEGRRIDAQPPPPMPYWEQQAQLDPDRPAIIERLRTQYSPSSIFKGILIKNVGSDGNIVSLKFKKQVHDALRKLSKTPRGRRLLDAIASHAPRNQVYIGPVKNERKMVSYALCLTKTKHVYETKVSLWYTYPITTSQAATEWGSNAATPGVGSDGFVEWDPENVQEGIGGGDASTALAHELIHAERFQAGESLTNRGAIPGYTGDMDADEALDEDMTVGINDVRWPITENDIRADMGMPPRLWYRPPADRVPPSQSTPAPELPTEPELPAEPTEPTPKPIHDEL